MNELQLRGKDDGSSCCLVIQLLHRNKYILEILEKMADVFSSTLHGREVLVITTLTLISPRLCRRRSILLCVFLCAHIFVCLPLVRGEEQDGGAGGCEVPSVRPSVTLRERPHYFFHPS